MDPAGTADTFSQRSIQNSALNGTPRRGGPPPGQNNFFYGGDDPADPRAFDRDYQQKEKLLAKWEKYFPHEAKQDFDQSNFKHLAVLIFFEWFSADNGENARQFLQWEKKEDNFEQIVVHINYHQLFQACPQNIKQFLEYIVEHPQDIFRCMALALDSIRLYILDQENDQRFVVVRIFNYMQLCPMSQIKSHLINKFVCLRGTVLRVSSIKVLVESITFQCHDCKSKIPLSFVDGKWETPNRCISLDCRCKIFNPEKHTAKTSFFQRIRVQEIENDIKDMNAGKMPKTIDCEIRDDLIDSCISGDIVSICGVMKTELQSDMKGFGGARGGAKGNRALHSSYIDVNSIKSSNQEFFLSTALGRPSDDASSATVNMADQKMNLAELGLIHKISERRDLFPLLVKSVCPSIFGNEIVKCGQLLALFGGTDYRLKAKAGDFTEFLSKDESTGQIAATIQADEDDEEDEAKQMPPIRPDIHMLMVGEPGLGKSQMLKHIINVAPRGVYVCGNSTTNAGLTATLVRDQFTNESNLEAGALVLSDLGICCIDEFDKMTSDQHTLLEAMEQQTVSIAKGGILGSLSARCSVVACANPASGHYNRSRTILENIRISNAILSRFDLVFLMIDDPDLQRDKKLSEHVMRLHSRNRKRKYDDVYPEGGSQSIEPNSAAGPRSVMGMRMNNTGGIMGSSQPDFDNFDPYSQNARSNNPYSQNPYDHDQPGHHPGQMPQTLGHRIKLQVDRIHEKDILNPQLLKKYISYARHTVFPKLSMEACGVIKDFYIALRENACNSANTLPITSRALDSLIRLSQARAKLELRTVVTKDDAIDVVKLIQESIFEACYTEMGIGSNHGSMIPQPQHSQPGGNGFGGGRKGKAGKEINPNDVGLLSIPKQTKFFVERLRQAANDGGNMMEFQEMVELGKSMNLQVGDFRNFVDKLNAQGILLKKNAKTFQIL